MKKSPNVDDDLRKLLDDLITPATAGVVGFREFVESPRYLGIFGVYDYWFSELEDRVGGYLTHMVLRGSTGAGKSTAMNLVLLYKIYLLFSKGRDVYKTLGLMSGSPIYILYFSLSMTAAKRSGFQQLRNFIDGSEWFKNNYPIKQDVESSIRFLGTGLSIEFASKETHATGLNVWAFILDEANFRKEGGSGAIAEFSEVFLLAEQLETRLQQRFMRGGEGKYFAGYISSASYASSFIQEKGDDLMGKDYALVLDPVLYKVDPSRYSTNRFDVFFGDDKITPAIVKDAEHRAQLAKLVGCTPDKEHLFFDSVPLELQDRFEKNIYNAIQGICGHSTALKGSFVPNYEIVKNAYINGYERPQTPLLQSHITVGNQDGNQIADIVDWSAFENPDAPHSAFLDLSIQNDPGSLTVVRSDGEDASGNKMHTHVFTLEIIPPNAPAMTDISKIQNFIIDLGNHINLAAFGSDQFQSGQLRQEVTKALDLPDIRLSIDATDRPHLNWLSALVSGRFRMLYYQRLDNEIKESIHDLKRHKVIKRANSTDDQFQSLVGAFFLSDTVGSSGQQLPDTRYNMSSVSTIEKFQRLAGYNPSPSADRVMKTLQQRTRMGIKSSKRALDFLDQLG